MQNPAVVEHHYHEKHCGSMVEDKFFLKPYSRRKELSARL
jgi:hypothetical protein